MSTKGEMGIIKRVPVKANYNEMIYDDAALGIDCVDVGRQTLSKVRKSIKRFIW